MISRRLGCHAVREDARNAAAGNYRELAWNWQKNVDGGINWMEEIRDAAEVYINDLKLSVPVWIGEYPFDGSYYDLKDIIAIQLYNGVEEVPFQRVYNSIKTDEGYETYGRADKLSTDDHDELSERDVDNITKNKRICFEFDWDDYDEGDYEENTNLWVFHSNDKGYVKKIIDEYNKIN